MTATTGNVTFNKVPAAPTGDRTIGDNSRFAPVSREDLENLLAAHGFATRPITGTRELVFCREIETKSGRRLELRVYSGCEPDGAARPRGQDAIRTHLWTLDADEHPAVRLRGEKKCMRVHSWRANLLKKLKALCDYARDLPALPVRPAAPAPKTGNPPCPRCGGPTTDPKKGYKGHFHGCKKYPACRGAVDAIAPAK